MLISSALETIFINTLAAFGRVLSRGRKCPRFNEMFVNEMFADRQ